MRRQCARRAPGSDPRGLTWRSRRPTWRAELPTWRPRRRTWWPRRPNLASRGRSGHVPERPRVGHQRPKPPKIEISSNFLRFSIDFSTIFARCERLSDSVPHFFLARSLTAFERQTKKNKCGYRFRLAFCCSSLPVQFPRSNPQFAGLRFTRCSKVSAPSIYIYIYIYIRLMKNFPLVPRTPCSGRGA